MNDSFRYLRFIGNPKAKNKEKQKYQGVDGKVGIDVKVGEVCKVTVKKAEQLQQDYPGQFEPLSKDDTEKLANKELNEIQEAEKIKNEEEKRQAEKGKPEADKTAHKKAEEREIQKRLREQAEAEVAKRKRGRPAKKDKQELPVE